MTSKEKHKKTFNTILEGFFTFLGVVLDAMSSTGVAIVNVMESIIDGL